MLLYLGVLAARVFAVRKKKKKVLMLANLAICLMPKFMWPLQENS